MKLTAPQLIHLEHFAEVAGKFVPSGKSPTCEALVRRGLLEVATGPVTGQLFYRITAAGLAVLQ